MEQSTMELYCQMANYCYACFLIDEQDPEVLFAGLCFECHSGKWDKIRHSLTSETIAYSLSMLNPKSKWFSLYQEEYKRRGSP